MSPARQIVIAAGASALGLGFVACATAGGDVGDLDAGQDQEAGGSTTPDAGTKPPKKDAGGGGGGGGMDSGQVGDPDASTCATAAPSHKCGVAPQCGCAPTETCDVDDYSTGAVACIAAGTAAPGKACTITAGCALGSTCIGNACKPYCPAGTSTDGGGAACGIKGTSTCVQVMNGNAPIPNLEICRAACDLVNPTSCDQPNAIQGIVVGCDLDSTNQPDCFKAGASTTTCGGSIQCAPSYVCVTLANDGGSACKNWCKVGDNTPCTTGNKTCGGFATKLLVNGVEYGACP